MATVAVTRTYNGGWFEEHVASGLGNGDQTAAMDLGHTEPERAFHITGTLGTTPVFEIQHSNDGTNWDGLVTGLAALVARHVTSSARFMRLAVTAGVGTSLNVRVITYPRRIG